MQTGMGSGTPAISFKQDGEALTGTYAGTLGTAVFKGAIKGTVEQDTISGDVTMAGGQVTGTFSGKRT